MDLKDEATQAKIMELEGNVSIAGRWIDALDRATFHGRDAMDVGSLIAFLKDQRTHNKIQLEKAMDAIKAPQAEFGKPDKVAA